MQVSAAPLPIPTRFGGVQFRSRLEARWAVFFTHLGLPWFYEYEGFQLSSGWYVPDFWLPKLKAWIEIKPADPSAVEATKCQELAMETNRPVFCFFGDLTATTRDFQERENVARAHAFMPDGWDCLYYWCVCPRCGRFGVEYDGRGARVCGDRCFPGEDRQHSGDHPRLVAAYEAASKARFY